MVETSGYSRRQFLTAGAATGTGLVFAGVVGPVQAGTPLATAPKGKQPTPEDISPPEDLMREHGVLNRILLIYDESVRRLCDKKELDAAALAGAAKIVRTFIEDYHAKLEEDHIFPRFEKAGVLTTLVKTLREQHDAGRRLTSRIMQLATLAGINDTDSRRRLAGSLRQFVRMYRPHEAREDTVLFPRIRGLMSPKQFDEMGDQFEDREHQLFGEHGFEDIVGRVASIEKTLGIEDLAQFTPKT